MVSKTLQIFHEREELKYGFIESQYNALGDLRQLRQSLTNIDFASRAEPSTSDCVDLSLDVILLLDTGWNFAFSSTTTPVSASLNDNGRHSAVEYQTLHLRIMGRYFSFINNNRS